ncbi:MAG: hypothetical protein GC161_00710 [Planctomycetaceae bacterium]|nr:hypothetical protein [Planctomycetaceae bacterium]
MVTLATLFVLLGCLGAGFAVLVAASRRARGWIETAALAFLLGVALSAAIGTALIAAAGPPSDGAVRVGLGLGVAAGLVALVVRFRQRRASEVEGAARERWNTADRALAVAASGFCVFALFYASSMPMHVFDPVFHFAYKGKLVAHEGFGTESWTDVDGPVGRIITHPNYPPALPVLHTLVAGAGVGFSEDATRPLMGVFAVAAVGLLFVALRGFGRRPALLGALSLAGLPLLYYSQLPRHPVSWSHTEAEFVGSLRAEPEAAAASVIALLVGAENAMVHLPRLGPYRQPDGWTLDGAADLPLAALLLAAAWCLGRASHRARGAFGDGEGGAGDLVLAGVLLAGAGLMKNEGLALGLLALAVYGLLGLVSGGLRGMLRLWPAAVLFALLLVPWMVLRRDIPSIDEDYPRAIARVFGAGADEVLGPYDRSPRSVADALGRVPVVVFGFVQSCLNPLRWNLMWVLFGLVFVWRLWRPRQLLAHPLSAPLVLVLSTIAAYGVILVVTPWELPRLYTTAIPDRLLLHVAPLALWCSFGLAWRRRADGAAC